MELSFMFWITMHLEIWSLVYGWIYEDGYLELSRYHWWTLSTTSKLPKWEWQDLFECFHFGCTSTHHILSWNWVGYHFRCGWCIESWTRRDHKPLVLFLCSSTIAAILLGFNSVPTSKLYLVLRCEINARLSILMKMMDQVGGMKEEGEGSGAPLPWQPKSRP